ncbi:hypothetical protein WJX73_006436 [Symbiochloris irregularis]|uniref:Centrosomal protein of 44 kDa n=1 Tax=Symbiochloris irregularis TaxID=706552 RepID=A0AAW1PA71_9CHLO
MTTGDLEGNISRLLKELASVKYPGTVDLTGLKSGEFEAFLPPLHFVLTQFSRHLTKEFLEAGNKLLGNNDHRFVESAFRIAREQLGLRTVLAIPQFFERGFAERKAILLHDIVQACRKRHHAALRRQRLASIAPLQVNSVKIQASAATSHALPPLQDGDLASTGQQVKDLQSTVARLEGRDAEAAKAAEVLKARVTLLEGSVRLMQRDLASQSASDPSTANTAHTSRHHAPAETGESQPADLACSSDYGWQSVFNLILTIASNSFYTYVGFTAVAADLSFSIVSFIVFLPLVLSIFHSLQRRNAALNDLGIVKTSIIHLALAHDCSLEEDSSAAASEVDVRGTLSSLVDVLHTYFSKPRFYARHYPITDTRARMIQVAHGRARCMRRIHGALRKLMIAELRLHDTGSGEGSLLLQLHMAIERMSAIKEFRTPVGLRALLLVYVVIILPLFFAPYYAFIRDQGVTFTFALFFAMVSNQAVMILYNVTVALEDPFDSQGLDAIFIDEALEEARQAVLGAHRGEEGAEGEAEEGDEGEDSPSGQDGDVVMPVDGLPLPPDSRAGAHHL